MSRLERLAALLEEPLLVTSGVNVLYLTGLSSSNAAVLVEPDGETTLFTDFRYARRASAIEGVRFERTARAVIGDLATRLSGRTIGIEAHVMTVAALETLRPEPVRVDRDRAWAALARDKKAVGGVPRLVLLDAPGQPRLGVELPAAEVRAALDALIAG